MRTDWTRLLTATTPAAVVASIARRVIDEAVASLAAQLDADPDVTPADRARLIREARPLIATRVTETISAAWLNLQRPQ